MFLAFGDSPRDPDHRPRVTQVLILTNVLVYLGLVAWVVYAFVNGWDVEAAQAVAQLGFFPMQPTLLQSVTYAFLHAGLVHLAGNMLYLWVYGPNLERRLGPVGFLALYIGAAVMGAAVHALWSIHDGPMVGASGAVSGVLGAYLMFFPANRIRFTFPLLPILQWSLPAWLVVTWFFITNLLAVFLLSSNVAYDAHLAGFVTGAVMATGLVALEKGSPSDDEEAVDRVPLERALQMVANGSLVDGRTALQRVVQRSGPLALEASEHLAALEEHPFFQRNRG